MPKSTKTFVLSTSQLNSHGFRALTDGVDLTDFIANPLMYWLHLEPAGKEQNEPLPIGFWEDIKVVGDEITAVPNFNDDDAFAMKIYKMVEHGTLRAASIEVEPLAVDANKKNWVQGQKLPTVTKWRTGEASIADRGSNKSALVKLKRDGRVISLAEQGAAVDFFNSLQKAEKDNMKIKPNKKVVSHLKLTEDAEIDATELIDKLVEVIEEKEGVITLKATKVTELEGTVKTLENAAVESKITGLVDKAVNDRKIVAGQKDAFIKLAKADFDSTKSILDGMKGNTSLKDVLSTNGEDRSGEVGELMKQSFDDLFNNGGLAKLKAIDVESYKLKFKSKFGKFPNE